jgi:hypothetical protein
VELMRQVRRVTRKTRSATLTQGQERQKSTPRAQNDLLYAIALARRTTFFRESEGVLRLNPGAHIFF